MQVDANSRKLFYQPDTISDLFLGQFLELLYFLFQELFFPERVISKRDFFWTKHSSNSSKISPKVKHQKSGLRAFEVIKENGDRFWRLGIQLKVWVGGLGLILMKFSGDIP